MTETTTNPSATAESVDSFRLRVRSWLADNMDRHDPSAPWDAIHGDDDKASKNRRLQRKLWDGGFAGICYPSEYGGLGLPIEYQRAFDEESLAYELPLLFSVPTFSITGPVVLEFGTEEQKQRYIPSYLRGDELWVQFMSEPGGGSDMAGALTTATRDGDVFLLNGSKIWSTYAYRSDFALCLVRTNWNVPKHRGLTMFIVPTHHPGIDLFRIKMVDETQEFCQEYFNDAMIPVENVVGKIDDGWTVATRLLFHERAAVGGASPYTSGRQPGGGDTARNIVLDIARSTNRLDDPDARQIIAKAEVLGVVQKQLVDRVRAGLASNYFPGPAGSLVRLYGGMADVQRTNLRLAMSGDDSLVWGDDGDQGKHGVNFIRRQADCLGGGSTEMARNLISERILGMPREMAADKDIPYSEVRHNQSR